MEALMNASFSIEKGEFAAVIGPSGSGKSTLLNLLSALDYPTAGKVFVDGRDIYSMKEDELSVFRRRNIGFVFQAYNLVPELNVEENITLPIAGQAANCSAPALSSSHPLFASRNKPES